MQATVVMDRVGCEHWKLDLKRICGPKYNAFAPDEQKDLPGSFFTNAVWKSIHKPVEREEEIERWDSLE